MSTFTEKSLREEPEKSSRQIAARRWFRTGRFQADTPDGRIPCPAGFGLVEVAMSLGIVSFALLALFGLMSVGLSSGKTSREDMICTGLAMTAFSELRGLPFVDLPTGTNFYFTYEGGRLSTSNNAYYECAASVSDSTLPSDFGYLRRVRLEIVWPVGAVAANRQTNALETHLAPY